MRNLTMLIDLYELTVADSLFKSGKGETVCYFDLIFRQNPDKGGFVIMAGLEQAIEYIQNLKFTADDINYLRSKDLSEEFLSYLSRFKFTCDVWAVPEGTPVFPNEPIVKVKGKAIEAQLIESMLLLCINHQSLIATKANRLVRAAHGREIAAFGTRRAQGFDGAVYGARAAYIGGCSAIANVKSSMDFGIPTLNTMTHSFVQMYDSEYEAFCDYAKANPEECSLIVDTYDTVNSGVPNAIKAFDTVLAPMGIRPKSVRIDSGDISYLSQKVRRMLNAGGYPDCDIVASNSLDEYIIRDMMLHGCKVDCFIVGERLITSASSPILGCVYKLAAVEENGEQIPKISLSENVSKITTPASKKVYRLFDMSNGKAIADYLTTEDETVDENEPLELFDPDFSWKRKTISRFVARELLVPIFKGGELVYKKPSLEEIRTYCAEQVDTLWDEVTRFENPHNYYVDLSEKLWNIKNELLLKYRTGSNKE
ncbi:MAG: nicotinate phosphoribosyltransferase [Clostridiales bacterium]|nr:nicotinate phosphoribosyltransferase [Clostridia bacterium]MCR4563049.1 nicotinate phosphoribosyltransferase [Clostridiales bacterium]